MTKLFTKEIIVTTYTVEYTIYSENNGRYIKRANKFNTYKEAKAHFNNLYECFECEDIHIATNEETKRVKRFGK